MKRTASPLVEEASLAFGQAGKLAKKKAAVP